MLVFIPLLLPTFITLLTFSVLRRVTFGIAAFFQRSKAKARLLFLWVYFGFHDIFYFMFLRLFKVSVLFSIITPTIFHSIF